MADIFSVKFPGGTFPVGFVGPFGFGQRGGQRAAQECREQLRDQDSGPCGPLGAGFGTDFGFGSGARAFVLDGFGPGLRVNLRGFGRGKRGRRGDVRAAILLLLAERPMHGYEMIQQIAERSQGLWRPSPGSVYPTLQMLADEGLIAGSETEGSKKLFTLTDAGRAAAEKIATPPWEEIADGVHPGQMSLRNAAGQLFGAVTQALYTAAPDQQQRLLDVLNRARRDIYGILGETD